MNGAQLRSAGARGEEVSTPLDLSRAHSTTAAKVAANEAYGGRPISIGASDGSEGPGWVTLTGAQSYPDAVVLAFRYRDGRESSRRLSPSTPVLVHRPTTR